MIEINIQVIVGGIFSPLSLVKQIQNKALGIVMNKKNPLVMW